MKRINAQWVFLIILALWIPVLCFADETMGPEQDQTVVEETIVVSDIFGPPHESETEELSLSFKIWMWGAVGILALGGIVLVCACLHLLWSSLRFNYYLYIEHGQFAWWFVDGDTTDGKKRKEVAAKYKMTPDDHNMYAWWCAWLFIVIILIAIVIVSFLWPISLIGFAPFFIVRAVAYRKRKKKVFQDKLKGNETNGLV